MVLIVSIFVPVQLDEVLESEGLPRDRVLVMLLHVGHDVDDVKARAVLGADLIRAGVLLRLHSTVEHVATSTQHHHRRALLRLHSTVIREC